MQQKCAGRRIGNGPVENEVPQWDWPIKRTLRRSVVIMATCCRDYPSAIVAAWWREPNAHRTDVLPGLRRLSPKMLQRCPLISFFEIAWCPAGFCTPGLFQGQPRTLTRWSGLLQMAITASSVSRRGAGMDVE